MSVKINEKKTIASRLKSSSKSKLWVSNKRRAHDAKFKIYAGGVTQVNTVCGGEKGEGRWSQGAPQQIRKSCQWEIFKMPLKGWESVLVEMN